MASLKRLNNRVNLLEVVMDLGRKPEARYRGSEANLTDNEITRADYDLNIYWTLYDGVQLLNCFEGQELRFIHRYPLS